MDLLFTDVVMPGMSGRALADAARAHLPLLKILYTSGYTRNSIVYGGRLDAGVEMIAKPFTYAALGQKIRDVLDSGRTGRILVVEVEPTVRSLAMELLGSGGYSVDEAGTATEGLSKIRTAQGRYDAVFIAEDLSEHQGHSVVAELRKLHVDMPALIAAESVQAQEICDLVAQDRCTGVIAKPYTVYEACRGAYGVGSVMRPSQT